MKFKVLVILLLLVSANLVHAQEITSSKFGKGIFNIVGQDSSWAMKIGARMQFLTLASWENNNGELMNGETAFLVRRARLKFDGYVLTPKLDRKNVVEEGGELTERYRAV